MPVAIILAAVVILGGVVVVAMGRGGELARERPDMPSSSELHTWSDVAHYRPPGALLGYHARTTEHALSLIARTIAERDAEIEWLRNRLAEARPEFGPYSPEGTYSPVSPYGPQSPYDRAEEDDGPVREAHPVPDASATGARIGEDE